MKNLISKTTFILLIFISLMNSSCSKKMAFTSELKKKYGFTDDQMKKIQFYTSSKIILKRIENDSSIHVSDGKVLINESKHDADIKVPKNTLCIITSIIDSTRFLVSVEDKHVLMFGKNEEGQYGLVAKQWDGDDGVIRYENKTYSVKDGKKMFLMFKMEKSKDNKSTGRTVDGKRVR